jgi:hypothetical protein
MWDRVGFRKPVPSSRPGGRENHRRGSAGKGGTALENELVSLPIVGLAAAVHGFSSTRDTKKDQGQGQRYEPEGPGGVSHVVRVLGSDESRVEEIRLLLQVITEGTAEKIQLARSAPAPPGAAL